MPLYFCSYIVPLGYSMALFLRKGSMIPCEHDKSNWQVEFYSSIFIDSAKVAHETGVQTLSLTEICFLAALFLPSHPGPSGYGSRAFGQSNELLGNQKNAQRVSHASSRPWLNTYVYIVPSLTYSIRLSSNGGLFGLQSEVWSWIFQHYTWQGLWIRRAVDRGSLWFDLGHVRRRFVQVLKTPVIRLHVKYVRILRDPGHVLLILYIPSSSIFIKLHQHGIIDWGTCSFYSGAQTLQLSKACLQNVTTFTKLTPQIALPADISLPSRGKVRQDLGRLWLIHLMHTT